MTPRPHATPTPGSRTSPSAAAAPRLSLVIFACLAGASCDAEDPVADGGATPGDAALAGDVDAAVPAPDAGDGDPDADGGIDGTDAGAEAGALDEARGRVSLVDHDLWAPLAEADDPFAAERPATIDCEAMQGYGAEAFAPGDPPDAAFYVSTVWCNHATFAQPALVDVRAGEELRLRLWRAELSVSTEAHVAFAVGDTWLLEETVTLGEGSALLRADAVVPADLPAGTPVRFHLHNHGSNEYALLSLTTGPAED